MGDAKKQPSCEDRIDAELESTLGTLRKHWRASNGETIYIEDDDGNETDEEDYEYNEDSLYDYGLSFDYVQPGTFKDQHEGYARYQLSWGGPSDEFRFYVGPGFELQRAEYWFLDWFDGASRNVTNVDIVQSIYEWFRDAGSVEHAYNESKE